LGEGRKEGGERMVTDHTRNGNEIQVKEGKYLPPSNFMGNVSNRQEE
jgi:hypothetical protein